MLVCLAVGVLACVAVAVWEPWQLATLVGWLTSCVVLLGWVWFEVGACDAEHTRERSTIEDPTRVTAAVAMVVASVMSLVGVAFGLAKAKHVDGGLEVLLTVCAVAAVVLGWVVVHTMFTLRYAHLYYSEPVGGLAFLGHAPPDYRDFAYFSFTIGMAFAVSDVAVEGAVERRVVLLHSLVSYLFGVAIIGLTINVVAGFVR